jgi:hypothetical protein
MIARIAKISMIALLATAALAQNPSPNQKQAPNQVEDKGWTSSMNFDGSVNSQERLFDVDSTVGYNFDKHWGIDLGVPFSFVSSSPSTTTTTAPANGKSASTSSNSLNSIGNVHMDVNYKAGGEVVNYASTLTVAAPTGSTSNGVSTGRPNFGWNNHLEHSFERLTPFIEAGFSNGLTNSRFFQRPFTTLGFISQFSGGSTLDLGHNFKLGASLYDVLPTGQQKMFSKLVGKGSGSSAGSGKHGRSFELASESVGDSSLTRDNGGSIWGEFSPGQIFDFQAGYTHSVHYALDTVSFNVGVNLGKLMKKANSY